MDEDLLKLTDELQLAAQCIPNLTHPDVPIGGEDCSTLRKMVCTSLYIYCTPFKIVNKLCVSFFLFSMFICRSVMFVNLAFLSRIMYNLGKI